MFVSVWDHGGAHSRFGYLQLRDVGYLDDRWQSRRWCIRRSTREVRVIGRVAHKPTPAGDAREATEASLAACPADHYSDELKLASATENVGHSLTLSLRGSVRADATHVVMMVRIRRRLRCFWALSPDRNHNTLLLVDPTMMGGGRVVRDRDCFTTDDNPGRESGLISLAVVVFPQTDHSRLLHPRVDGGGCSRGRRSLSMSTLSRNILCSTRPRDEGYPRGIAQKSDH